MSAAPVESIFSHRSRRIRDTHSITIAGSLPFPTALTPNVIVERGFPEYPSAQCTTPYPHFVTSEIRWER
jgi:hypothetical protein